MLIIFIIGNGYLVCRMFVFICLLCGRFFVVFRGERFVVRIYFWCFRSWVAGIDGGANWWWCLVGGVW